MPRNSGGTYSLPAGNPVVTGTTVASTWANGTMNDLKAEMTDSLSRSNKGAMLAQFQAYDGSVSVPGIAFGTDPDTGFYAVSANLFRMAAGGARLMEFTTNKAQVSGTAPAFQLFESDAAADNNLWNVIAAAEEFKLQALTDALVATDFMTVTRTAGVVDSITLEATNIVLNGYSPSAAVTTSGTNTWTGMNTFNAGATFGSLATFTTNPLMSSTSPGISFTETDAAANNKTWRLLVDGEKFRFQLMTDGGTAANFFEMDRTAQTADQISMTVTSVQMSGILGVTGVVTAGSFSGSGASITALNASALASGTVADARLSSNIPKLDATSNFTGALQISGVLAGFLGVPQSLQAANYTLVLGDSGKEIHHAASAGSGDTYTIPANGSVAFPIGTVVVFTNLASATVDIAITTDTLTQLGSGSTGTRTLAQYGQAVARKVASTAWVISGTNLS